MCQGFTYIILFNPDSNPRWMDYYPHFTNQQAEAQRGSVTCPQVTSTSSCCPGRTFAPESEIKGKWKPVCLGLSGRRPIIGHALGLSFPTCTGGTWAPCLMHSTVLIPLPAWWVQIAGSFPSPLPSVAFLLFRPPLLPTPPKQGSSFGAILQGSFARR